MPPGAARLSLLAALLAGAGAPAAAPLPAPDLNPLIATIGLPRPENGARLLAGGETRWRSSVATASHSVQDSAGGETLLFDGETTQFSLALRRGFGDRYEFSVELPYLLHESGGLDGAIDRWHDWFGFPDGLRAQVAEDRLDFRYADGDDLLLDVGRNRRGPGDLRLGIARSLQHDAGSATALRATLKLPTGDSDRLTGSGAADLSLGIVGERAGLLGSERWGGHYGAHLTLVGTPDRLPERARDLVGTLHGGLRASVTDWLELAAQATLRSAAYDAAVEPLGSASLQLNVGGTLALGPNLRLAISVGEDVRVDTAPDVTFGLSLYRSPDRR